MKLAFFDDFKLGVVKGDTLSTCRPSCSDIPHVGPGDLISGLIARFDDYRGKLEAAATGAGSPLSSVRIRPPLPKPGNIVCMAVNYMENGTLAKPAPINAFHKAPTAIIGPDDTMVLPDVPATIFEGEAEMAVVIGKRASNVPASQRDGSYLWLHQLHRRFRSWIATARQRVLLDEVSRHVRADRAVPGDQRRDRRPAETADQAVGQWGVEAGFQY